MRAYIIIAALASIFNAALADVYDVCDFSEDSWREKPNSEIQKSYDDWKKHLPEGTPFTSGYEHWQMTRSMWNNPYHCWQACEYCVQMAIDINAKAMRCERIVTLASCKVVYGPRLVDDRID